MPEQTKPLYQPPHADPDHPYHHLWRILMMALDQAENGKGKERHADNKPFHLQPICEGARTFGPTSMNYQAWKKTKEAVKLLKMENGHARYVAELLGAINYNAAAILAHLENSPFEIVNPEEKPYVRI